MDAEGLRGVRQTEVQSKSGNGGVQLIDHTEGLRVDCLFEIPKQRLDRRESRASRELPEEQIPLAAFQGHLPNWVFLTIEKRKHLPDVFLHD